MDIYATNIRACCDAYPSISAVCRRLDINRQQFNKYLSGAARPSRYNERRICELFGLDPHELHLPPEEFAAIFSARRKTSLGRGGPEEIIARMTGVFGAGERNLWPYHGYYFKYFGSMTDPGMIKRDLCHVFAHRGFTATRTKERDRSGPRSSRRLLSYNGLMTQQAGRIFWLEFDRFWNREISLNIIFPSPIHEISVLEGLILGTGLTQSRDIAASKVVLDYLGPRIDIRAAMRAIDVVEAADPSIPRVVRDALSRIDFRDRVMITPA
ncbi:MAG: helix-turn-helix domain-containing protein [Tropicimonas sp.]|uniref:helix-turn-helix domain-containing protein n=1 Tax=Tropicimonas sp. TaxID=2067044 RepID=UPI003A85DF2B